MSEPRRENRRDSVVFFGGADFSIPSLDATAEYTSDLLVVTHTPTRVGRKRTLTPSLVATHAQEHKLDVLEVATLRDSELLRRITTLHPALGVCASFGMIFPRMLITLFPRGIINVHPSLLPRHRGPSPVQWTIHSGDTETGVTLFCIDEKVDHGPILVQKKIPLPETITGPELLTILAQLGANLLSTSLPLYMKGVLKPKPQDDRRATTTPMLTKECGEINWSRDAAVQIEHNIRAFTPWPGVWTTAVLGGRTKRVALLSATADTRTTEHKPGSVILIDDHLALQTTEGLLYPTLLQLEGGRPLDPASFLRGHHAILGARLT